MRSARPKRAIAASISRRGLRIARAVAGNRQPPRQMLELRQCGNQQVIALARHHRANREQRHRSGFAGFPHGRAAIRPRLHDADPLAGHAIVGFQHARGRLAGRNHVAAVGQYPALARAEGFRVLRTQTGFQRQRVVHQGDHPVGALHGLRRIRQHAERQPIDHDRRPGRQGGEARRGGGVSPCGRAGKAVAESQHTRVPAAVRQFGDDPPIVGIAAGRRGKVARHREHQFSHNGASYQARATGDSETVTRTEWRSLPSRPSLPERAACASRSYRYLVRNSVVVLVPRNCGRSSRFW